MCMDVIHTIHTATKTLGFYTEKSGKHVGLQLQLQSCCKQDQHAEHDADISESVVTLCSGSARKA